MNQILEWQSYVDLQFKSLEYGKKNMVKDYICILYTILDMVMLVTYARLVYKHTRV